MINPFKKKFKHFFQLDQMDCGPACIRMVAAHYGKDIALDTIRDLCYIDRKGVSVAGMEHAVTVLGFDKRTVEIPYGDALLDDVPLPCIAYWQQQHFVVIYDIKRGKKGKQDQFFIADPAFGLVQYEASIFKQHWLSHTNEREELGVLLLIEPTPNFYAFEEMQTAHEKIGLVRFFSLYLMPHKRILIQLLLGLLAAAVLSFFTPFLTQAMVDQGVQMQNQSFVVLILFAQLLIFFGDLFIGFIRSRLVLFLSMQINIAVINGFIRKLMRLPISYFEAKNMGDILQRMHDHQRIEHLLTGSSIETAFSLLNILIFGTAILFFNPLIFVVFFIGVVAQSGWIFLFLHKRKQIDYKLFNSAAANSNAEVELITAMPEVKLNNCEDEQRSKWQNVQANIYKAKQKSVYLAQYQLLGSTGIHQLKNMVISFLSASAVIRGDISLGTMLSLSFIVGQLNAPFQQLIGLISQVQDAKLSLERIREVHNKDEEDAHIQNQAIISGNEDIVCKQLSFRYGAPDTPFVLDDLSFTIPAGKTTAIVGSSGSGKTTLLKVLLKFYLPSKGDIQIGSYSLKGIHANQWREQCGAVLQDGYLFADTIAKNIAVKGKYIEYTKLQAAAQAACIDTFITENPLGYNAQIGMTGTGISGGQKQRILIARALYKEPHYLFFDEATSALDVVNEATITANISKATIGKTKIVVAHRLSTVKEADQILVLEKGKLVEQGSHTTLVANKGTYYHLIKNQLEIATA